MSEIHRTEFVLQFRIQIGNADTAAERCLWASRKVGLYRCAYTSMLSPTYALSTQADSVMQLRIQAGSSEAPAPTPRM